MYSYILGFISAAQEETRDIERSVPSKVKRSRRRGLPGIDDRHL